MTKIILLMFLIILSSCQSKQSYITINGHKINVEIADTSQKRTQGLSDRPNLPRDSGMLFKFDKPGKYGFWMKDMKFSLDFIYINNKVIIETKENIPFPQTNEDLKVFYPTNESDSVLEVNSGLVAKYNIKPGDEVVY